MHNVTMAESQVIQSLVSKGSGFPWVLLLTGDHDDLVMSLHSHKLIAELQHQLGSWAPQRTPLPLRIDTKSGHSAGTPLAKTIEENAELFAFIEWSLGAKPRL